MTKISEVFYSPISRFSVLLAGFYSFMWGLWVFWPWNDAFPTSQIYALLAWTGSELIWGGVNMVIGMALIWAAFDSRKAMKYASLAGFVSWFLIALSFAFSSPQNAGMWVTGYLAANFAYFYLRLQKEVESL